MAPTVAAVIEGRLLGELRIHDDGDSLISGQALESSPYNTVTAGRPIERLKRPRSHGPALENVCIPTFRRLQDPP